MSSLTKWKNYLDFNELYKIASAIKDCNIVPERNLIMLPFEKLPPEEVKVILLFQDPYVKPGVATGIPCANKKGTEMSPTLKILKSSIEDLRIPNYFYNFDPTLETWIKQGVLILNTAFTAEAYKTGSHIQLWRKFVSHLLMKLSEKNTGIVYVLFGENAKTFRPYIKERYNYVFEERHPSYYARFGLNMPCDIWVKINQIIINIYGKRIEF